MAGFDLSNYSDVATRIEEFVKDFPEGNIKTFLRQNDDAVVVIEARVYETRDDVTRDIYTSGFAREVEGKSNVNKTSHLENCETSAIGRALANKGYGTSANRASRQEMLKVERMNRELKEYVEYIATVGKDLPDGALANLTGEPVSVKDYIRANWDRITEQFPVARQAARLVEAASGVSIA